MFEITINLILTTFILLPGIIWATIWMRYSKTKPQTDKFYFLIYSLVASVFCYFATYFLLLFFFETTANCPIFQFSKEEIIEIFNNNLSMNAQKAKVIGASSVVSIFVAILSVIGSHKKIIIKIMNYCKITTKNGDEDLWEQSLCDYMLKSKGKAFIRIHDFRQNLIYHGQILHISEDKREREILLDKVEIFERLSSIKICDMNKLYLAFDHKNFMIELLTKY